MTIKKKAKQLALTLIGEDQNPQPLIDLLVEMAEWQMKRDAVPQELVDAYWEFQKAGADAVRAFINAVNGYSAGKGQAVIGLDEELEKYYGDNGMFTDGSKVRRYNGDSVNNTWDYADVARHFAAWQREQMVKEAVEAKAVWYDGYHIIFDDENVHEAMPAGVKDGDKVKLIIIKQEEE